HSALLVKQSAGQAGPTSVPSEGTAPAAAARSPEPRRGLQAAALGRGGERFLQAPEGVEVRVHKHERLDQPLYLLGHPADLLPADRLERAAEALVQPEQVRNVAHTALAEPAHQLAVVAHQLLGLATDVDRHATSGPVDRAY